MRYQVFPNLTADEFDALSADIKERGIQVPVEVDEEGNILDGHHRVMVADSLGVNYPTVVRTGWTEEQKLAQVIGLNAHRRHLTEDQRRDVVAELRKRHLSTRTIAKAVGVDQSTVVRDLGSIDASASMPDRIDTTDGRSYPAFRPRLDPAPDPYFAAKTDGALALAPEPDVWAPSPALMSSDSAEWYTPKRVLDAVVATLGAIDLDPCADPERSVPATTHYTIDDDGLAQDWTGRVYMNPPYGRAIVEWIAKLAVSFRAGLVTEAVALVPGRTETDWFAALDADWQCQVHGRLAFSDHETSAPFPSVAVYLGPNGDAFTAAFSPLGDVFERRGRYPR